MKKPNPAIKFPFRITGYIPVFLALILSACGVPPQAPTLSTSNQAAPETIFTPTPFYPGNTPEATNLPIPMSITKIPDPAKYQWEVAFSGFDKPLDMASPPGDATKIVIVEQPGVILLVHNGMKSINPFLDIRDRVSSKGSEQGLLGIAFHPKYAQNRFFFVNYTDVSGNTVIARFTAAQNGETADPKSEKGLIQVDQPFANHNGGGLAFGPDGYLYIGLGDGGSGGDPQNNSQNVNTLLGKMLRIDVNQPEGYTIPADNPFAKGGGKPEIWAYGLRNPWRFSFDSHTGDLYIADVGQNIWEELNFLPGGSAGGANFGWRIMEANHPYRQQGKPPENLISPLTEYDRNSGCSITGGYVYRGQAMLEWQGVYFFGDYCQGTIWGLLKTSSSVEIIQVGKINANISSFGEDSAGEIYALDHQKGDIYKLVPQK